MSPRSLYGVAVMPHARDTIAAAAAAALPRETGGVLLGWRGGTPNDGCTVARAVEVPDGRAGYSSYQRKQAAAELAVQDILKTLADADLGYVGEWHSHPQNQPPSAQDCNSIRAVARLCDEAVVLLVPARLDANPTSWAWRAIVARRSTRLPVVVVRPAAALLSTHDRPCRRVAGS